MYPNVENQTESRMEEILHETFGSPTPPMDEILRHKWLESEKAGRDIGLATSIFDWKAHHYDQWRQALTRRKGTTRVYLNSRPTTRLQTKTRQKPPSFERNPVSTKARGHGITLSMWLLAGLKARW